MVSDENDDKQNRIEPVAKDTQLFEFLELLFYDDPEPSHFPERIDLNTVSGSQKERLGPTIMSLPFAPVSPDGAKEAKEGKKGGPQGKPTREKLVAISNRLLFAMQRDCDENRRQQTYGIHAWHFGRGDAPFARFIKTLTPKGRYTNHRTAAAPVDDDEDSSLENRFGNQILRHQERMVALFGGGFEGMLDRFDRMLDRAFERIEKQDATIQRQADMLERSQSAHAEREQQLEWTRLKTEAGKKALEFGLAMAPPLLSGIIGKQVAMPGQSAPALADTAETITLKNFFRSVETGGSLTNEQANAAFGVYDETPQHNVIRRGVLAPEQAMLLFRVAHLQLPVDELDKLLPDKELQITPEQAMALQKIFSLEQLAPLMVLFEGRRKRQETK